MKEQHKLFILEYLKDYCGKDAAIRAGYSPRSAACQAARLTARDDIKAEIARAHEAKMGDSLGTRDEAIEICWRNIRKNGRDSSMWMEKLIRVQGWATETTRLMAFTLPAPSFTAPDEIPGPPTILPDLEPGNVVKALSEPEAAAE